MQIRHDVGNDAADAPDQTQGIVSKWRQKERLKTTAVALVLCLNIGVSAVAVTVRDPDRSELRCHIISNTVSLLHTQVDPPDVIKISPCARLECWVDPLSMQPPKALETIGEICHDRRLCHMSVKQHYLLPSVHVAHALTISRRTGKNLQAQYERWQGRAKYRMHLDPTMEDVKKLAISCRRTAKVGRLHAFCLTSLHFGDQDLEKAFFVLSKCRQRAVEVWRPVVGMHSFDIA